ncbi:MAG: signal peptidase I [Actinomycetota bacterium]|nr:signal peptidase I [Actinomycetota bacterium]
MTESASGVSGPLPGFRGRRGRRGPRRLRRLRWWHLLVPAVVVLVLVRSLLVQTFSVPTGSMQETIAPGDRVLVSRLVRGGDVHRGDVVVFDGRHAFLGEGDGGPAARLGRAVVGALTLDSGTDYVKRVVGLPGDRVTCCTTSGQAGRLAVNGVPVTEPYLFPGDAPSDVTFDVVVPPGAIWVMGDHRSASADSRSYLGQPGGGMVDLGDVVGQVTVRYWPLGRLGSLGGPGPLSTVPAPGAGP